jgi:hypothetical protein
VQQPDCDIARAQKPRGDIELPKGGVIDAVVSSGSAFMRQQRCLIRVRSNSNRFQIMRLHVKRRGDASVTRGWRGGAIDRCVAMEMS